MKEGEQSKNRGFVKEMEIGKVLENREKWMNIKVEKSYHICMSEESKNNLEETRELLDENEKLNLMVYSNHIAFEDPWIIGSAIYKIDPKAKRHWIVPTFYSRTGLGLKSSMLKIMCIPAKLCEVETIRVIQAHEVKEDAKRKKSKYKPGEVSKNYRQFLTRFNELGNNLQPTAVLIFPEGHRSDDGKLQKDKVTDGMLTIAKKLGDTIFVDIAISYDEKFHRGLPLNFGKSLTLTVGKPYLYKKGEGEKDINFYMNKLAKNLPEGMRGEYAQMPEIRETKV